MLPGCGEEQRIEQETNKGASSSRSQEGSGEDEESKENQVVSSLSETLKTQRKEHQLLLPPQESEENAKVSSDEDKKPSTTTGTPPNTSRTGTDEEVEEDMTDKKSDEEPLAKRARLESSDEEKFTDIVLASEGFRGPSSVRVKPVVLAPRTNGNYHHAATAHHQTVTSSASVVVSVKPRIQPHNNQKRRYPPPLGRLPSSGSAFVEEWFRKMKPPLLLKEEPSEEPSNTESAMNLSLKSKPITLKPNKGPSLTISSTAAYPRAPLSPPRLELKKMISSPSLESSGARQGALAGGAPLRRSYYYPSSLASSKKRCSYNKPSPQTDLVYSDMMDAIKDRAVRDLHLAHTKDMHGNFPIHMSVLMRKPSLVRRYCCVLHILNSNVDLTNEDKYTALHLAVLDNSVEIVELLLSFGADPSIKDHRGNTCFHQAVAMRSNDCLKLLVEHLRTKEDLDSFNNSGFTALQIAIKKNDPASVHTLIQSGANLNIPENYKTTTSCHLTPKNEHNKIVSDRYLSLSRLH